MTPTKKTLAALAVAGGGLLATAGLASAHGPFWGGEQLTPEQVAQRQQTMFEHKAALLGISVDEFKAKWAEGKTLREIAQEQGISEETLRTRLQEQHTQRLTEHLNTLVDRGVITREQADRRLQVMKERMQQGTGKKGLGHRGFHHGFGEL